MPRKTEPHVLRAAKALSKHVNPKAVWDLLAEDNRAMYLATVRLILRAAGRGGKQVARFDNLNDRRAILIDCGKARSKR